LFSFQVRISISGLDEATKEWKRERVLGDEFDNTGSLDFNIKKKDLPPGIVVIELLVLSSLTKGPNKLPCLSKAFRAHSNICV
jgi:hypothetical protein